MAGALEIQPDHQGARKAPPGGAGDDEIEAFSAVGKRDAPGPVMDRLGHHPPAATASRRDSCWLVPTRRDRSRDRRDDRSSPARRTCPQHHLARRLAYLDAEPAGGTGNANCDPVERRGLERVAHEQGGIGAELLIRLPPKVAPRHQPARPGDNRGPGGQQAQRRDHEPHFQRSPPRPRASLPAAEATMPHTAQSASPASRSPPAKRQDGRSHRHITRYDRFGVRFVRYGRAFRVICRRWRAGAVARAGSAGERRRAVRRAGPARPRSASSGR